MRLLSRVLHVSRSRLDSDAGGGVPVRGIGRRGFKVVLLRRLSHISPFVVLNYLFSLAKVSFWEDALGLLIGMIPGTVMFVYFGADL